MKTRVFMTLLGCLLLACGAATPPCADDPPPSQLDAEGPSYLRVRAVKLNTQRTEQRPFVAGDTAKSGELFAFYVQPDACAYVYVIQFMARRQVRILFPDREPVRFPAGGESRIPRDQRAWFRLDDAIGEENVYLVASRRPLETADPDLAGIIHDIRLSPSEQQLPPDASGTPESAPASAQNNGSSGGVPPAAGVKAAKTSPPASREMRLRAKGAQLVRIDSDVMVFQQDDSQPGASVSRFTFEHR